MNSSLIYVPILKRNMKRIRMIPEAHLVVMKKGTQAGERLIKTKLKKAVEEVRAE